MELLMLYSILLFSLSFLTTKSSAQDPTYVWSICSNTTFPRNSQYQTNLNTVLRSLSTNATANPTGFFSTSAGTTASDTVYGFYLCRGDQNATACRACVAIATSTDLPKSYCPKGKQAVIWYDQCMVRYSNESLTGGNYSTTKISLMNTQNIPGNRTQFTDLVRNTMNQLAVQVPRSRNKYETKQVNFTKTQPVYALEQCIPDLTENDCGQCLKYGIGNLMMTKEGAQVLTGSCIVRFEIYPFYNGAVNYTQSSPPAISNSTRGKKKVSAKVILAIVVPVVVISLAVFAICACLIRKKAKKTDAVAFESGEDFTTVESLQYDLSTVQSATDNFAEEKKLGEGGFGVVYKGKLSNGQEIAVKRLSKSSGQGVQEFKNEVLLVAKLQHRNLVRLLGFCVSGEEKLLVYEYVPNKSLDYFLFDPTKQEKLNWAIRYKIIRGIARGMLYLHQDSRLRIIHRDLKASNILLDLDMNPKISDFGMARIFGVDQTQGNTSKVVGTYGYMSPEYAMHGQFSVKSDVYSFGVLVLEIVSGKKNTTFYESGYAEDLLSYAWKLWNEGIPLDFVDPTLRDSCSSNEVMRCMHLGLLCVQESVDERPTMEKAVLMLDSHSVSLPVPEQPAFFIKTKTESATSVKDNGSDQSGSKSVPWSTNDISISEIEPR